MTLQLIFEGRSHFLIEWTSTAKQVLGNYEKLELASLLRNRLSTYTFWFCLILLFVCFCCQPFSYDSGCKPLNCTCLLLYALVYCWVCHASCKMQNVYVIWNENEGHWQIFSLLMIYLKHCAEQNSHFLKSWYLKWKGLDRNRHFFFRIIIIFHCFHL